jgi:hypothetical protein
MPARRKVIPMGKNLQPPNGSQNIRTKGFTYVDWRAQLGVAICAPIGALLILGLTNGGPSLDLPLKIAIFVAALAVVDLAIIGTRSVRAVEIDASGVTFHYLFNKERGRWSELSPGRLPPEHGMWAVIRTVTKGSTLSRRGFRRAHYVTLEQARAIVLDPHGPNWNLLEPVATRLGITLERLGKPATPF